MQQEIAIILKENHKHSKQARKKAEQDMEWLTLENNKIVTLQRKIQYKHWEEVHLDWEKCNNG